MPIVFEVNNDLCVGLQNVVQNFCAWQYQWIICIVIWNVQRIQLSPPNNMKEKYYTTTYIFSEKIFNVGQPQSSAISTTSVWIFTPWQYFSSITFYALLFAYMKTICNNNNLLDTLISFIRHLVYPYYEFNGSHFCLYVVSIQTIIINH